MGARFCPPKRGPKIYATGRAFFASAPPRKNFYVETFRNQKLARTMFSWHWKQSVLSNWISTRQDSTNKFCEVAGNVQERSQSTANPAKCSCQAYGSQRQCVKMCLQRFSRQTRACGLGPIFGDSWPTRCNISSSTVLGLSFGTQNGDQKKCKFSVFQKLNFVRIWWYNEILKSVCV